MFRKKLTQQAVYLLIQSAFVWATGMAKVVTYAEFLFYFPVTEKLCSPIHGHGVNRMFWQLSQVLNAAML